MAKPKRIRKFPKAQKLPPSAGMESVQRGLQHFQRGEWDAARTHYLKALQLRPNDAIILNDLGAIALEQKDWPTAEAYLQKALRLQPDLIHAYTNLAQVHAATENHAARAALAEQGLRHHPDHQGLMPHYCQALTAIGSGDKALAFIDQKLGKNPQSTLLLNLRGDVCHLQFDYHGAIDAYTRSLAVDLRQEAVMRNVYRFHMRLKQFAEARTRLDQFESLFGLSHPDEFYNKGLIAEQLGDYQTALQYYLKVLDTKPQDLKCRNQLCQMLYKLAQFKEAHAILQEDVAQLIQAFQPDHGPTLFTASISDQIDNSTLFALHQAADNHTAIPADQQFRPTARVVDENTVLRIGFVSGDFKNHPVSKFMLPLAAALRKLPLELHAFANVMIPDNVTNMARQTFTHWHSIAHVSDANAAQLIAQQQLDILIDLSGHTNDNRLKLLQWRPAPIQCAYLGYTTTIGYCSVDYWILDKFAYPEHSTEQTSEQVIRLNRPWVAFTPNESLPEPQAKPIQPNAPIVFGSANATQKYSETTVRLFARVLKRVPHSILILKTKGFENPTVQQGFTDAFAAHGISAARLRFVGFTPDFAEHVRIMQNIDIALDTTPFSGGTTTVETLWMGIPVLTLTGPRFVNRMSSAMLAWLGLQH